MTLQKKPSLSGKELAGGNGANLRFYAGSAMWIALKKLEQAAIKFIDSIKCEVAKCIPILLWQSKNSSASLQIKVQSKKYK